MVAFFHMIGSGKQYADLYYISLFQTKLAYLKFRPTLIYGTSVYNLHFHYYLLVNISLSFIIIVLFVLKLNKEHYTFLETQ